MGPRIPSRITNIGLRQRDDTFMTASTNTDMRSIPIAKPTITGEEGELLQTALASGWVSMGGLTKQFEEAVCDYTGAKYAVAVNSCTSAIHLSMLVYDIGFGDEVICPSYSFIATANGIRHAGAEPRFVDIDANTLNLDPVAVSAFIESEYDKNNVSNTTGNTLKAILTVHQIGIPSDIDALATIAKERGLKLIEDNACGLGSTYKNKPLGNSGLCNTLSFHPRKVITSGEGGMLLTNDKILADKASVLRAHGMSISDFARHHATSTTFESYEVVGYNYRLTDLQSALGLTQMKHLDEFVARRREIGTAYNEAFKNIKKLSIITVPDYVTSWNYQSYPLRLQSSTTQDRNDLMEALFKVGIATRRGIPPIHKEPVYAKETHHQTSLPNTEAVSSTSLMLPIFPLMSDEDVAYVIEHVSHLKS